MIGWLDLLSDNGDDSANECKIDGNCDSIDDGNVSDDGDKRGTQYDNTCGSSCSYVNAANNVMQMSGNTSHILRGFCATQLDAGNERTSTESNRVFFSTNS